jgi:hypothetical protein
MVSSSGMFISSTAFLPSSFSMYCTMVAVAAWLEGLHQVLPVDPYGRTNKDTSRCDLNGPKVSPLECSIIDVLSIIPTRCLCYLLLSVLFWLGLLQLY